MNNEIKLMIQNKMINNNLLKLMVASNVSSHPENKLKIANELDEMADDIVKSRLAFENLINSN